MKEFAKERRWLDGGRGFEGALQVSFESIRGINFSQDHKTICLHTIITIRFRKRHAERTYGRVLNGLVASQLQFRAFQACLTVELAATQAEASPLLN